MVKSSHNFYPMTSLAHIPHIFLVRFQLAALNIKIFLKCHILYLNKNYYVMDSSVQLFMLKLLQYFSSSQISQAFLTKYFFNVAHILAKLTDTSSCVLVLFLLEGLVSFILAPNKI